MFAVIGAPESVVFVSALILMLLIGLVQLIGLGGDFEIDAHADLHLDADVGPVGNFAGHIDLLGWLGIGRLPLMMLIVVFLAVFGITGLLGEQASHDLLGSLLPTPIAIPAALAAALPLTGVIARILQRILPRDETSAVPLDALVGRAARIVNGRASQGSPARARVEDTYGLAHYVMVEPNSSDQIFEEGEAILLVRRDDNLFRAISRGEHHLPQLGV